MIVIISMQQPDPDGPVDDRFGRAPYYLKVDTGEGDHEIIANPGAAQSGGAGIAAAQFVVDQGAKAVVSGDFGPNALRVLQAAGVDLFIFDGQPLTGNAAYEKYKNGELPAFQ